MVALTLWATSCLTPGGAHEEPRASQPLVDQCRISLVDESELPSFTINRDALDAVSDQGLETAFFAMGCFWGSEAILAAAPGVIRTEVGFSGGQMPNPNYSAIGDHVETVKVVFDPNQITYQALLEHFWKNHNAQAKPIFRQYASAVFTQSEAQRDTAKRVRESWQHRSKEKLLTAIVPLTIFYAADQGHQKYYLQQDKNLLKSLPSSAHLLNTKLATKLNAVNGRAGERSALDKQLEALGIARRARQALFRRALWSEPDTAEGSEE